MPIEAADRARAKRQREFLKEMTEARKLARMLEDKLGRLEEIAASGQTSTHALLVDFKAGWERLTGDQYVTSDARDLKILRELTKQLEPDDIRARMARYFSLTEAWVQKSKWSLPVFRQLINSLGGAAHTHVTGQTTSVARSVASELEAEGWLTAE